MEVENAYGHKIQYLCVVSCALSPQSSASQAHDTSCFSVGKWSKRLR
ncbi:hypothetical protein HMPREF9134_01830 [Porphyromonas catoniae F0037]|uniref:Uncharacterized protein n=1 Tax=Porphyromonas catoniae F0037 TaxID=1127696 RepID=L1N9R1_9PORP|nr:hypothetical protein HMPREF9134_01830 [Porphyromonas catoniae F0037]